MKKFPHAVFLILFFALASLAGVGGGFFVSYGTILPRLGRLEARMDAVTSTQSLGSTIVSTVARRPPAPLYPEALVSRAPIAAMIVKRSSLRRLSDRVYSVDRPMGTAVAVTADGWFATASGLFMNNRLAELSLVWNGRVFPLERALRDTFTDVALVKIDAREVPVVGFISSADIALGESVWIESSSAHLYPDTLVSVRGTVNTDSLLSERGGRRFLVSGTFGLPGSPVWNVSGRLVGLLDARTSDGWQVIPADHVRATLTPWLAGRTITHAVLGVRSVNLASVLTEPPATLPAFGAWLKRDRSGAPAVLPGGPAFSFLKENDVIERVERDTLDGSVDLASRLLEYQPGAKVTVYGKRDQADFSATITLGKASALEELK